MWPDKTLWKTRFFLIVPLFISVGLGFSWAQNKFAVALCCLGYGWSWSFFDVTVAQNIAQKKYRFSFLRLMQTLSLWLERRLKVCPSILLRVSSPLLLVAILGGKSEELFWVFWGSFLSEGMIYKLQYKSNRPIPSKERRS